MDIQEYMPEMTLKKAGSELDNELKELSNEELTEKDIDLPSRNRGTLQAPRKNGRNRRTRR